MLALLPRHSRPQRRHQAHQTRRYAAGDTLIEVLFAVATFSLVVVTSLSIMNQGTAASIRSLQITLVRQEIDSQAETIRFLSAAYIAAYHKGYAPTDSSPAAQYYSIIKPAGDGGLTTIAASEFGGTSTTTCPTPPSQSFVLNTSQATVIHDSTKMVAANTFAQVTYDASGVLQQSQGLWVEAARPLVASGVQQYIDFHIRACWYPPGTSNAMNLGTIVRLYVPTN